MWLGCADPVDTMETARDDDPELLVLGAVMAELNKVRNNGAMTAGELRDLANEKEEAPEHGFGLPKHRHPELRQALLDAAGIRGEIDGRRLGGFLKRYKGRMVNQMKLVADHDRHRKQLVWRVEQK
jgi:hypothetical protein